ncbi:filamentous hemagglutinin N-terminal domain-containing protein [Enterobacteriaceae bacterium 4M9]|nr:filamentous hemagglutinin N-terminal domain-containing protein [Enterobacteriaceae bacterium 4M9]
MLANAAVTMTNGTVGAANGVPVVNINGANANGISHNIYSKLDVGKEGLIFNNSQNGVNTTLAGQIAGNSNLASGTAKVILNEVTSTSKSALAGMMEVAGDKAHLIIANPNGISCSGCGFINTDKVTMTTGTPDMQNGELKGFSVKKGIITTEGVTSDSPTAIMARSVVVNGDINTSGQSLDIIAGNNYVDMNNQVTGSVTASGSRNTYSIDVSKLGGMYANRISLVSTENGVGVRNLGNIAAGTGGIQIDTKGQLINSNAQIASTGAVSVKTNGALQNVTGKILSDKTISIDTNKGAITNTRAGNIMSGADVYVSSGALDNTNGKVAATGTLALNTNNATLTNSGKGNTVGIEAGIVALQTGTLDNRNGQIKGYYVGASSTSVNNSNKGQIDSWGDVDLVSTGTVNNTGGLIRAATGHVLIDAAKATINNGSTKSGDTNSTDSLGIIAGDGGIQISAATLNNSGGQIVSSGTASILNTAALNNTSGKIQTEKGVSIKAASMTNSEGSTTSKGDINVETSGAITNRIGAYSSEEGAVNIKAGSVNNTAGLMQANDISITSTGAVNNSTALIVAKNNVTINTKGALSNQNSNNFGGWYGVYFGMPNQEGGLVGGGSVDITAASVNNDSSRIVAKTGPLKMNVSGTISSSRSMLIGGAGENSIKANTLTTNYSTIYSSGNMGIDVRTLNMSSNGNLLDNNATGIISSDGELAINLGTSFTNYGWINGKQKVTVKSDGILYNRNTIYSNNEVDVYGKTAVYNYNDMVGDAKLTVGSTGTIYNSSNMYTQGAAYVTGRTVTNTGSSAYLGGKQGLTLNATTVNGNGTYVGL